MPGPYKETESERSRASRRSSPSALTTPEERRQRQADNPPMQPKPHPDAVRSERIYGDKGISSKFKY
jgi:hypothetical protein